MTLFKDARHFASWVGLTPREHPSGGVPIPGLDLQAWGPLTCPPPAVPA
ncbi:MAG: transposase [Burkholderiaceae bacterium]